MSEYYYDVFLEELKTVKDIGDLCIVLANYEDDPDLKVAEHIFMWKIAYDSSKQTKKTLETFSDDEPPVKLLIWNDETKAKEHGRPDPAYIIGLGSGSVLELKNNKDHTILHMEVGEVM